MGLSCGDKCYIILCINGGVVLYAMRFVLDFWEETTSYLGGNQEMNSMFNILHKVLDQLAVVPCWLDLATHYLGAKATRRKFECKSCPITT